MSENSIYKVYNERELLERQTYMGPVHEVGGGVTKSYDWTAAVTSKDVWTPLGSNRWIISSIVINVETACTITLFDEIDNEANRLFKGALANTSTVVIPYPIPRPSAGLNTPLQITTGGGKGYVTIYGWESGVGIITTTTSVSTSSSSSISSSSSSVSTSSISTSSISSSSSSVSTSSISTSSISSSSSSISSSSSSVSSSSSSSSSSSVSSSSSSSSISQTTT